MAMKRHEIVDLALRCTIITFSIISVGLLAKAYVLQDFFSTDGEGNIYDMMPWFSSILAVIWTLIATVLIHCHRRQTRFNARAAAQPNAADTITMPCPPVFVTLDFLFMALTIALGTMLLVWTGSNVSPYSGDDEQFYRSQCDTDFSLPWSNFSSREECIHTADLLNNLEWAGSIFSILSGIIQLVLFVDACKQCHRWRKARDARKEAAKHGQDFELNVNVGTKQ